MASEVDQLVERSTQVLDRVAARSAALQPSAIASRRAMRRMQRFIIIAVAGVAAITIATGLWAAISGGIGILGVVAFALAIAAMLILAALFSREGDISAAALVETPLPQIADMAGRWIQQERLALPPPAQSLTDSIGQRIAALRPQLQMLDGATPPAQEMRRLIGEELPVLVESYKRVPVDLRQKNRNGRVAEQELLDGLRLLDTEISQLSSTIAATDMDKLASHTRYLELRYQDDTPQ
ncbi:MAG: hypothetical protein ACKOUM_00715 [Sphingopyxis sp.]